MNTTQNAAVKSSTMNGRQNRHMIVSRIASARITIAVVVMLKWNPPLPEEDHIAYSVVFADMLMMSPG